MSLQAAQDSRSHSNRFIPGAIPLSLGRSEVCPRRGDDFLILRLRPGNRGERGVLNSTASLRHSRISNAVLAAERPHRPVRPGQVAADPLHAHRGASSGVASLQHNPHRGRWRMSVISSTLKFPSRWSENRADAFPTAVDFPRSGLAMWGVPMQHIQTILGHFDSTVRENTAISPRKPSIGRWKKRSGNSLLSASIIRSESSHTNGRQSACFTSKLSVAFRS